MPRFHPTASLYKLRGLERKLQETKDSIERQEHTGGHNAGVLEEASVDVHWALIFVEHAQMVLRKWIPVGAVGYGAMADRIIAREKAKKVRKTTKL